MSDIQGSYSRVNYLLRPSKQVERKMIVEALQKLLPFGYDIPSYRYVGMGSVYYVDFLLFYKHLHITDMLCVEARPIAKRMEFNKPYEFITVHMGKVAEVLPGLDRAKPHLIWLDYDKPLDEQMLGDLSTAINVAAPGSLVLITVTAQLGEMERAETVVQIKARSAKLAAQYGEWFAPYVEEVVPSMLSRKNLGTLFSRVLRSLCTERVSQRRDAKLEFLPIFNYRYADGQIMLTYGGLIETPEGIQRISDSSYLEAPFVALDPNL